MDQTAITYPQTSLTEMTGTTIKEIMEDVCDNLFNPDPYKQQGGDMVRVGGISYTCDLRQGMGKRINNMMLNGKALDPNKKYKVAGWAPVAEGATGEPIWDVVSGYLRDKKVITPRKLNLPKLVGIEGNNGIA
jgi:sulfur-oxidizing protein SoxB